MALSDFNRARIRLSGIYRAQGREEDATREYRRAQQADPLFFRLRRAPELQNF